MLKKLIFPLWIILGIALFLYSYTQVDLSLTLSRASIFQVIEKGFQYVGYFNRPLSTYLFLTIIGLMFILYGLTLKEINKRNIDKKILWKIIIVVSVILFASYNAFSYDLFNYIFDAKIITHYQSNPYIHTALQYPQDPMLSFMHWTHRTYPYGPAWLFLTVPLSYLGLGYFIVTFYLFKSLTFLSFIGSVYVIGRIATKSKLNPLFCMAAFALNPLVLIESLVSAHNDIVMMFFALLGIMLFIEKKHISAFFAILFSILIKFATVLIVPAILAKHVFKIKQDTFFYILIISMLIGVVLATTRTTFQPWYLLLALPFAAFMQNKYFVMIPVVVISIAALLQYVPYLYLGNYDPPVPYVMNSIMVGGVVLSLVLTAVAKVFKKAK